jgi:hypothetical protein
MRPVECRTVAALYVEPKGCYVGVPGVDPWDEARDARTYAGPHPVVAHPPCQLWGAFAPINYKRWGGEHNRPGNDGGCFASALESVRRFGWVLEHPAKTRAWAAHGLAAPSGIGWQRCIDGGWVCEVWQSAYGHRAAKATWLYYCGKEPPLQLRWDRPNGTHQIGFHDQRGKAANKPTLGKREANATPAEFRDALIALARHAAAMYRQSTGTSGASLMNDAQAAVFLMRGLIQLGITLDDYQTAISNPDMSPEDLAQLLRNNNDRIKELLDREHEK